VCRSVPGHPLRRTGLFLLLTIGLWGLIASYASAASVVANGNAPDAVVDRDGITHVVWNEARPGIGDVLHYCQVPRGATACTNPQQFIPDSTDQALNIDFEGPHVMITPFGEVILLTHRCCQPIMGQSSVNVVYVSDDGGLTFGPQTTLSSIPPGETSVPTPVVFDGAGRNIVTMSAPTEGIHVQAAPLAQGGAPQPYTSAKADLTSYSAYNPSIVQRDATSFVAAWADLNGTSYFRTVTCPATPCTPGAINNPANWTPQVAIANAEYPRLTTGPNGTFLMYRSTARDDTDDKYFLRRIDGTAVGPAMPLSDGKGGNFRDIVQDAGGILHALYTDRDAGLGYRASADGGVSWGDQQTLVPGPDYSITHVRVTARTVDEGFTGSALWESNDGGSQNPPILMQALPDPSASLQVKPPPSTAPGPAPAPAPPVPPAACRLLTFAAVDVIADACLTRQGDTYTATGGVRINGLRVELGSGRLKFDTKARTISSSGARVTLKVGDTVLFKDEINWTLPKGSIASLGSIDVSGDGDLLGFPLEGRAELKLRGGGAEIPVHLGLPALFGGVTGDVTIRADNVAGVHLRELHVRVGDALIGPLEIKDLFFDYDADNVSWAGGAKLILPPQPPGPSLDGNVGFSHGDLDYLSNELTLPGPGIALDPFAVTYLKKIRFSLTTDPLRLSGGVTVNAGPTIAGVAAIGVDGDLTFTLADPAILRVDGRVSIVSIPLGKAYFELRTNGYIGFGGELGYTYGSFEAKAHVDGWLFKTSFNVEAGARICLGDLGCTGGDVVFSSVGFAGCVQTFVADFGAGMKWGEGLDLMFTGCDIGPYRATASAAQAGGERSVTFAKGLPSGVVAVEGQGAPPHVSLVGPGGVRIDAAPAGKTETPNGLAFHVPEANTTYFVLKAPAAGTWTVAPAADSVPITGVKSADGLDDPKVTARVRRAPNGRRELTYTTNSVPGQKVTFAEQGKGAARPIGTATGRSGTLRFTPADGPGGTRRIIAIVSSYGRPRTQLTVASYVAPPPPRPATPRRLKARRAGTKLSITWAKAANGRRYEVRATLSDGRRLLARQRGTRFTIPRVAAATRATITVAGLKADGTRGRKATVKVAVRKTKTTRKRSGKTR
jgi:hypothetical protein